MHHDSHGQQLAGIEVLILDIDHVIHHYDTAYARQFSVATAESFIELHGDKFPRLDIDELTELAVLSYRETGRTTALLAEKFGVDEMELYVHHHDKLCEQDGYIDRQFATGKIPHDPELYGLLEAVKDCGVELRALTNGTKAYGEKILDNHGIIGLFTSVDGMDSIQNPYMLDKRHGAFLNDMLDKWGLLKRFAKDVCEALEPKDHFTHETIALIDDGERNLRSLHRLFKGVAVHKTPQGFHTMGAADMGVKDVKDLLRAVIESKKPSRAGHYPALAAV